MDHHARRWQDFHISKDIQFKGEFPIAEISFSDPNFPGRVKLKAFNPFIPLNEKDSSIPAAFFEIEVENNGKTSIDYSIALTVRNPNPGGKCINRLQKKGNFSILNLGCTEPPSEEKASLGDISISTDAHNSSCQEYWFRGSWFDSLSIYWRDFTAKGGMKPRIYPSDGKSGGNDHGTIMAHLSVGAGEKGKARFIISWNFPIFQNYWNPQKCEWQESERKTAPSNSWKNYYATIFKDSTDSAIYGLENWTRLLEETEIFKNALFSSSLPSEALDAISANISILKTPTSLRLEDGSFYGFEGCCSHSACCEGSCTHVWNYAYAMPFLFPSLERSLRDLDYKYNLRDDGGMPFRLQLPVGRDKSNFRPCVDGQFGNVIKVYRDWKISGDNTWMKSIWPSVKKSIEFAWAKENKDLWDPKKSGVITGRQHHTLDMELFGPNAWLTGFYLAALKAGAEMADACGEPKTAKEYVEIFTRGRKYIEKNLFNGEYYSQSVNLKNRDLLKPFADSDHYWNEEHREIKYQIADGCGIDQVLAQWHANICGLGDIFDKTRTKKALKSIYKYNFRKSFRNFVNFCRLYALNDESGTTMFSWPKGKYKPIIPIPYAEETMHGCEYQVASHMIMEGMVKEGRELVKAVRDRYDGERRNPWNEIECGGNYARSMASYALLNAFSGFSFNLVKGEIVFNPPKELKGSMKFFWSIGTAWGLVQISKDRASLKILYGELKLKSFVLPDIFKRKGQGKVTVDGKVLGKFRFDKGILVFDSEIILSKNCEMIIS